jgi:hypothetical protein
VEYFTLKPGLFFLFLGLLLTLPLSFGPIVLGPVTFSLYWMLFGMTLAVLGLFSFFFGCLAEVVSDYTGRSREKWTRIFRYTRAVGTSACVFLLGLVCASSVVVSYFKNSYRLPPPPSWIDHLAVSGLLLLIVGFSGFVFTLLLHATGITYGKPSAARASTDAAPDEA